MSLLTDCPFFCCNSRILNQEEINGLSKSLLLPINGVNGEPWKILSEADIKVSNKIHQVGKPLKSWDLKINFGIKTGLNAAFIISKAKRDELVYDDPHCESFIKPLIRGRNTKRYKAIWGGEYLINTHNGIKSANIDRIHVEQYPSIKKHLDQFWKRLKDRSDQGDTPYNLRNCAYLKEFSKKKIVWKRIGSVMRFSFSDNEEFCLDSTCIATGEKIKYLTGILNSKLCIYQLFKTSPKTGTGDQIISVQALDPLEVYYPNEEEEALFNRLVDYILFLKNMNDVIECSGVNLAERGVELLEQTIDALTYELYFKEEFKENGIEIFNNICNIWPNIDASDKENSVRIICNALNDILSEKGDVLPNFDKIYKLEEIKAIEEELRRHNGERE